MTRLQITLVLGMGLLLSTTARSQEEQSLSEFLRQRRTEQSSAENSRKRPEARPQEEQPFGREAERTRLARIKAEIDQDAEENDRDRRWVQQQLEDVQNALMANIANGWKLVRQISRWRCPNGLTLQGCFDHPPVCRQARVYGAWAWAATQENQRERQSLELRQKELGRKQEEIKYQGGLILDRKHRYSEDMNEFKRTAPNEKRLEFDEFPKPKRPAADEKRLEFEEFPKPKGRSLFDLDP